MNMNELGKNRISKKKKVTYIILIIISLLLLLNTYYNHDPFEFQVLDFHDNGNGSVDIDSWIVIYDNDVALPHIKSVTYYDKYHNIVGVWKENNSENLTHIDYDNDHLYYYNQFDLNNNEMPRSVDMDIEYVTKHSQKKEYILSS